MKVFFDTSVLVATFWGDHAHHDASLKAFASTGAENGACAAHTLAELYAVLTRLPVRPAVPPSMALVFIEEVQKRLTAVALSERDYGRALAQAAGLNLAGGQIYDALILAAAEKWGARRILTWNIGQFRRIAPALAPRIQTP